MIRRIAGFVTNVVVAVLGTAIFESSVLRMLGPITALRSSVNAIIVREWTASLVCAALIAVFALRWGPVFLRSTAPWVWILPVCVFVALLGLFTVTDGLAASCKRFSGLD